MTNPESDSPPFDTNGIINEATIRPFEWLTSPESLKPLIEENASHIPNRRALHVGCGSSTVGEFLLEKLEFEFVADVDKDEETMKKMKDRWLQKQTPNNKQLELRVVDFTQAPLPYEDNFFGLVLDKSTLDCTLCSDNATASLLTQVYRCLAVGGIYLLISFHELQLLEPLLAGIPGTSWEVTHTTMQRQVESIVGKSTTSVPKEAVEHNDGNSKLLNVLVARKLEPSLAELDFESVCQHVHRVNDEWFQEHQPLMTRTRTEALQKSFATSPISLDQAYVVMFTEAEREHLTYEHFLEDWESFLNEKQDLTDKNVVTFDVALAFLNEMQ